MSEQLEPTGAPNGRDDSGRFTVGNTHGKGRPRRAVESDYLRALSDALSLDVWREIVAGAIESAKAGDGKAREWLSRYALGVQPESLMQLATDDVLGLSAERLIESQSGIERARAADQWVKDDARQEALRQARYAEARASEEAEREARRRKREAAKEAKARQNAPEASP